MSLSVNHPTYQRVLKLLDSTIGREKLMRTVQYWSRFFAYYLYMKGYSKETIQFWKNLQAQLTVSRKLFRVGKPLSHLKLGVAAFNNQTADPLLRLTTIGRQIGYFGYMTLDTVIWLHATKIRTLHNPAKVQQLAQRLWLFGIVSNLINSTRRFYKARENGLALAREEEKDGESLKKVQLELKAAQKQFLWDLLDSTIPISGLGLIKFDDGFVGLCGLITSVLGLQQVW